ncbi:hypothetical protein C497_00050 [Halalkalicoccus jeotgali B3]|uniref:Uncharacterized protein n=2 Tax=Halalkalicoccus jeotgali TaxID=413810 RepID=D8JD82_HALJB|nr:hypothetical protein HacjB3_19498 [Halalkalicoccus jeotgali B3]ELY41946.1 hypothetical protein C497_00050 [Halalkalicoccus jeotgali B3]
MNIIQLTGISLPVLLGILAYYGKHIGGEPDEITPLTDDLSLDSKEATRALYLIFFSVWVLLGSAYFLSFMVLATHFHIVHPIILALSAYGLFIAILSFSVPIVLGTPLRGHFHRMLALLLALLFSMFSILFSLILFIFIANTIPIPQSLEDLYIFSFISINALAIVIFVMLAVLVPWENYSSRGEIAWLFYFRSVKESIRSGNFFLRSDGDSTDKTDIPYYQ